MSSTSGFQVPSNAVISTPAMKYQRNLVLDLQDGVGTVSGNFSEADVIRAVNAAFAQVQYPRYFGSGNWVIDQGMPKAFKFTFSNSNAIWEVQTAKFPDRLSGAEFILYVMPKAKAPFGRPWTLIQMRAIGAQIAPHPGYAQSVSRPRYNPNTTRINRDVALLPDGNSHWISPINPKTGVSSKTKLYWQSGPYAGYEAVASAFHPKRQQAYVRAVIDGALFDGHATQTRKPVGLTLQYFYDFPYKLQSAYDTLVHTWQHGPTHSGFPIRIILNKDGRYDPAIKVVVAGEEFHGDLDKTAEMVESGKRKLYNLLEHLGLTISSVEPTYDHGEIITAKMMKPRHNQYQ